MVVYTRLAVSLALGLVSLGSIAANPSLNEIIDKIPDAQVKKEVEGFMAHRDMDAAEAKLIKYAIGYADEMKPENESDMDSFQDHLVDAIKTIHEGFKSLKEEETQEQLEESTEVEEEDADEPSVLETAKEMAQAIKDFPDEEVRKTVADDILAGNFEKAEADLMVGIEKVISEHPEADMSPHDEIEEKVHDGLLAIKKEIAGEADEPEPMTEGQLMEEEDADEPSVLEKAEEMAHVIQDFPDEEIRNRVEADIDVGDFVKAEADLMEGIDKIKKEHPEVEMGSHVELEVRVHDGMSAIREEMKPVNEVPDDEVPETAKLLEDTLSQTLEEIKANRAKIEALLAELDGHN